MITWQPSSLGSYSSEFSGSPFSEFLSPLARETGKIMNKTAAFLIALAASSFFVAAFLPPPEPPVGNNVKPAVVGVVNGVNKIAEAVIVEANK